MRTHILVCILWELLWNLHITAYRVAVQCNQTDKCMCLQAVEAKEGVEIQNETVTLASISYQNFFRSYPVCQIPSHMPDVLDVCPAPWPSWCNPRSGLAACRNWPA